MATAPTTNLNKWHPNLFAKDASEKSTFRC